MSVPPEQRGPHLAAAFICEKVLKEIDGVTSVIRMVDRLTIGADGPDAPDEMPTTTFALTAVVILKSGAARGRHVIRMAIENPAGVTDDFGEYPMHFPGEEHGVELLVGLNLVLHLEGLYWINVSLGSEMITRIPFRLLYQPTRPPRG